MWACSQCCSVEGQCSLEERAAAVDELAAEAKTKLTASKKLVATARQLERAFADRVTNPVLMGKTGEPLCLLLPVLQKMVMPKSLLGEGAAALEQVARQNHLGQVASKKESEAFALEGEVHRRARRLAEGERAAAEAAFKTAGSALKKAEAGLR